MNRDLRTQLDAIPPEEIPELIAALSTRMAAEWARRGNTAGARDGQPDTNLDANEAARRLGVSRDWVYRNAGQLPFKVQIGRRVLFSASGLVLWNRQRQGH